MCDLVIYLRKGLGNKSRDHTDVQSLNLIAGHYKKGNGDHHTGSLTIPFFITTHLLQKCKKKIPEFYNESAELNDIMSRWEFLKYRIRQFSSEFSKQKAVERKASRLYL